MELSDSLPDALASSLAVSNSVAPPPPMVRVGGGSGIPFNGNQIKAAVAYLPAEQAEDILWLFVHGRDGRFDLESLARRLKHGERKFNSADLYSLFRGRYNGGSIEEIVAAIRTYRALTDARDGINRPPFVSTKLARKIFGICARARAYQRLAMVFGDGQIGKTASLKEYARLNPCTVRYLRLPTQAPLKTTTQLLADACYLNAHRPSLSGLRVEIVKHFDAQMILIVDELQQITLARTLPDRLATVEFLREIFDQSGCGMILCGTNEAMQEMENGPNSLWLRQLRRRAFPKITLPSVAADTDILAFAAHFGLGDELPPDAMEEARRIAAEDGVGLLITYFQGAARMAVAEQRAVNWEHFLRTVAAFADQGTL